MILVLIKDFYSNYLVMKNEYVQKVTFSVWIIRVIRVELGEVITLRFFHAPIFCYRILLQVRTRRVAVFSRDVNVTH